MTFSHVQTYINLAKFLLELINHELGGTTVLWIYLCEPKCISYQESLQDRRVLNHTQVLELGCRKCDWSLKSRGRCTPRPLRRKMHCVDYHYAIHLDPSNLLLSKILELQNFIILLRYYFIVCNFHKDIHYQPANLLVSFLLAFT